MAKSVYVSPAYVYLITMIVGGGYHPLAKNQILVASKNFLKNLKKVLDKAEKMW